MPTRAWSLVFILLLSVTLDARLATAETLVESNADVRTTVTLKVKDAEAQKLLPAGWQVAPLDGGPAKGGNLLLVLIDRIVSQGADGKASGVGPIDRALAVVVPAKHGQTGAAGPNVVGVYSANPKALPGPYKNSVQATLQVEQSTKATDLEPATVSEAWSVRERGGGVVSLRLEYPRGALARSKSESKIYGGPDPAFFRIYRVDQATDLLRSVPTGTDRLKHYQLHVSMPELKLMFDGTEQVISVVVIPLYVRQVSLP